MPISSPTYRIIKICGLTSLDDAQAAVSLGADLLGLVMHPQSPRFCKPEAAAEIIREYDLKPAALVFADNEVDYARDLIRDLAGELTLFQAPCESKLFQWLSENVPARKIIPVYSVKDTFDADEIQPYHKYPWIALDTGGVTAKTGELLYGGTGLSFNWNLVRHLKRRYLLAGGLKPENIVQAINVTHAAGFDVSSGVENSPGKKDFEKMKSLISHIRNYGRNSGGFL